MPVFRHDGIEFYYEHHGTGPCLVFSHGMTGDCTQITDMLGDLPDYSLIVWDARGHGRTEPLGRDDSFTFERFGDDLAALLDHLQVTHAVLGGVSMGAGVSMRLALARPELARALVFVRPAWLDQPSPEPLNLATAIGSLLEDTVPAEARRMLMEHPEFRELQEQDPLTAAAFLEQFDKSKASERSVRLRRMPTDCPVKSWAEVSKCMLPAIVIGSPQDYVHPLSFAKEWARRLPNAAFAEAPSKLVDPAAHQSTVRTELREFLHRLDGKR